MQLTRFSLTGPRTCPSEGPPRGTPGTRTTRWRAVWSRLGREPWALVPSRRQQWPENASPVDPQDLPRGRVSACPGPPPVPTPPRRPRLRVSGDTRPPPLPISTQGEPSQLGAQPGKARQNRSANLSRLLRASGNLSRMLGPLADAAGGPAGCSLIFFGPSGGENRKKSSCVLQESRTAKSSVAIYFTSLKMLPRAVTVWASTVRKTVRTPRTCIQLASHFRSWIIASPHSSCMSAMIWSKTLSAVLGG